MEPIDIPITDIIDLHCFQPREVPSLLDEYFRECVEAGFRSVRVVHGKGTGVLKRRVLSLLERHPLVTGHSPAPAHAGGWGATIVYLAGKTEPPAD